MAAPRPEDDTGHQETAGLAIVGMGLLAAALYLAAGALDIELGFIDGPGILGIFAVFCGVGTVMVWASRRMAA